jgi:hypothetical protein
MCVLFVGSMVSRKGLIMARMILLHVFFTITIHIRAVGLLALVGAFHL